MIDNSTRLCWKEWQSWSFSSRPVSTAVACQSEDSASDTTALQLGLFNPSLPCGRLISYISWLWLSLDWVVASLKKKQLSMKKITTAWAWATGAGRRTWLLCYNAFSGRVLLIWRTSMCLLSCTHPAILLVSMVKDCLMVYASSPQELIGNPFSTL